MKAVSKPAHVFRVDPGETLVLYTDGLVEQRVEPIEEGLDRLCSAARGWRGTPDELADHLIATVGPQEPQDDIALLVIRREL